MLSITWPNTGLTSIITEWNCVKTWMSKNCNSLQYIYNIYTDFFIGTVYYVVSYSQEIHDIHDNIHQNNWFCHPFRLLVCFPCKLLIVFVHWQHFPTCVFFILRPPTNRGFILLSLLYIIPLLIFGCPNLDSSPKSPTCQTWWTGCKWPPFVWRRCHHRLAPAFSGSSVFLWFRFVLVPRCSMYGIFTYIWVIFRANVGTYSIHGAYGVGYKALFPCSPLDPLKLL